MEVEIAELKKVKTVKIDAPVRYDDEDMPYDFPFRSGDMWSVEVDADTGVIRNWPEGVSHDLYMKVVDTGTYTLLGEDGQELYCVNENYVPDWIPGEYGDYLVFSIGPDGKIAEWDSDAVIDSNED